MPDVAEMLAQQIASEVAGKIAPHRVNVVALVLRLVSADNLWHLTPHL